MPTCKCGKEVDDWRAARGHVQFTAGDGHGKHQELPEGWKADLFDPDDTTDDEGGQQASDDADDDTDDQNPTSKPKPDSGESDASKGGRLRRLLTTPIDELLGNNGE